MSSIVVLAAFVIAADVGLCAAFTAELGSGATESRIEALVRQGRELRQGLRYTDALAVLSKAVELAETLGSERFLTAIALTDLAEVHRAMGAYDKAEPLYKRALAIDERVRGPMDPATATALNNLAVHYYATGAYSKAEPLFVRALGIYERALGAEVPETAGCLNNLAELYRVTGAYTKAEPLYQRTITIYSKLFRPEDPNTATAVNNLALLYEERGDYDKAEALLQRALASREKTLGPEHPSTAKTLSNLAWLYEAMGSYGKAEPLYQRALAIRQKSLGPEHPDTVSSLNSLGVLYDDMGAYDKAEPLYRRALAVRERILGPEHPDTIGTLNNLAMLYSATGAYGKAEPLSQRALALFEKTLGPDHPSTALALNNLAAIYYNTAAYAKAEPLLQRALAVASDGRSPELLWRILGGLAGISAKQQRGTEAILFGKQAVNTIQAMRGGLTALDSELRKPFLNNKSFVYRDLASRLIDAGRFAEAQQVLAMLKEEEYFDFVRRDGKAEVASTTATYNTLEQPWQDRYLKISGRVVALGEELRLLVQTKPSFRTRDEQARIEEIDRDLNVAHGASIAMLKEMHIALAKQDTARVAELAVRQFDVSRMGLLRHFRDLGEGAALLQYILLDDGVRILLTTGEVQKPYKVAGSEKDINRVLFALQAALRAPDVDPRPAAKALYDILIAPVADDLTQARVSTVMVSLDGALRYVPFSALYDGTRYVAEKYAVTVFNEAAADRVQSRPKKESWTVAGLGVTRAYPGFTALEASRAELNGIVKRTDNPMGILEGVIYLDDAFTQESLRRALSDRYAVVHVASHFRFTPGTDKDSFLLLGDGSHLDLAELRQGRYDFSSVDLLALSACETAVGGGRGSEIEGMAVSAQKQGAKAVIASLWPVADNTTAVLMQRMYQLHQARNLSKGGALREAQLELMRGELKVQAAKGNRAGSSGERKNAQQPVQTYTLDPDRPFAHPYYWAPFILMGNWL